MSSGAKEILPLCRIAGIDVTEDGHLERGGLADAVGHDPQILGLGRAADESRHGKPVGPQSHGVGGVGELLADQVGGPRRRALQDEGNAARVLLPERGGDSFVHRDRVGLGGDDRRQRRSEVPQTGRQTFAITNKMIHRHRAQTPRSVGKDPIHPYQLTGVHVVSRVLGFVAPCEPLPTFLTGNSGFFTRPRSLVHAALKRFLSPYRIRCDRQRLVISSIQASAALTLTLSRRERGPAFMYASTAARVGMPAWPPRCVAFSPAAVAANRKAVGISQP